MARVKTETYTKTYRTPIEAMHGSVTLIRLGWTSVEYKPVFDGMDEVIYKLTATRIVRTDKEV